MPENTVFSLAIPVFGYFGIVLFLVWLTGCLGECIGGLIKAGVSRQREHLADARVPYTPFANLHV
jgi:hypothetical protein